MRKESGFSMLEILVSVIIIMSGVLGIAGMQLLSINNTEVARYQSLAALLASSMGAEIQGNVAYWGTAATNITVNGAAITGIPISGTSCLNAVCTPTQLAAYDLQNWGQAMAGTPTMPGALPGGSGTIACAVIPAPTVCTLTLNWSEKTVASLGTPTGSSAPMTYTTVVTVR